MGRGRRLTEGSGRPRASREWGRWLRELVPEGGRPGRGEASLAPPAGLDGVAGTGTAGGSGAVGAFHQDIQMGSDHGDAGQSILWVKVREIAKLRQSPRNVPALQVHREQLVPIEFVGELA